MTLLPFFQTLLGEFYINRGCVVFHDKTAETEVLIVAFGMALETHTVSQNEATLAFICFCEKPICA
jgi:hypothetical protein